MRQLLWIPIALAVIAPASAAQVETFPRPARTADATPSPAKLSDVDHDVLRTVLQHRADGEPAVVQNTSIEVAGAWYPLTLLALERQGEREPDVFLKGLAERGAAQTFVPEVLGKDVLSLEKGFARWQSDPDRLLAKGYHVRKVSLPAYDAQMQRAVVLVEHDHAVRGFREVVLLRRGTEREWKRQWSANVTKIFPMDRYRDMSRRERVSNTDRAVYRRVLEELSDAGAVLDVSDVVEDSLMIKAARENADRSVGEAAENLLLRNAVPVALDSAATHDRRRVAPEAIDLFSSTAADDRMESKQEVLHLSLPGYSSDQKTAVVHYRIMKRYEVAQEEVLVLRNEAGWRTSQRVMRADANRPLTPIKRVEPRVPEEARLARASGIVIIEVLISSAGDVRETRVIKGMPYGMEAAAIEAAKQYKFPAGEEGRKLFVTITFSAPAPK